MKNYNLLAFFFLSGFLLLSSCKKIEKEMFVTTGVVTDIWSTSATVAGEILDLGEGITEYGHCYSKTTNPSVAGTKTEKGVPPGLGGYISELENLDPGTKYYVKAYVRNKDGIKYGDEIDFKTLQVPVITTAAINTIKSNSAGCGGNVTDNGGSLVTAQGVCWSSIPNPVISGSHTFEETELNSFTSTLIGLSASTKYFVRAYATNIVGTGYGNEVSFTTSSSDGAVPTVTTTAISSITANSAVSGGEVTSDGGTSVTGRGVCWSINSNPEITDSKTTNGMGTGLFSSNITGLSPNTTYFVRAYATNNAGTAYGQTLSFPTINCMVCKQVTYVNSTFDHEGSSQTYCGSELEVILNISPVTIGNSITKWECSKK